ncbi:DUF3006 family protein [Halogeometricum limi]|uniref:DUF3006 family protein n=1 Tax=Halogeometricum limi TaxID=555875 RepID=A0A1I6FQ00_9EURY|nr:DUF3006 family protein [Halogeometricum limi]SFR32020.1 Protein of unknown function [Halogeometricum limi]
MSTHTYTAVVDRFEEEDAVLLLEADGETVDELVVPRPVLPADGRHRDAVFAVTLDADRTELVYRPDETDRRRDAAQRRFDRLARPLGRKDRDEDGE